MNNPSSKCCWIYVLMMSLQDLNGVAQLFFWNGTEKIQTALTDHIWNLERKTQKCLDWLFSVPQTGVGEEGASGQAGYKAGRSGATQGRALSRRVLHWKPFPPPPQGPILSMDIDLELERGSWAGLWWGICSTSWQNKPVRSKVVR